MSQELCFWGVWFFGTESSSFKLCMNLGNHHLCMWGSLASGIFLESCVDSYSGKKNWELPPNQSSVCVCNSILGLLYTWASKKPISSNSIPGNSWMVFQVPHLYCIPKTLLRKLQGSCCFYYLLQILVKCCFVTNVMKSLFQESVIFFFRWIDTDFVDSLPFNVKCAE